MGEGDAGKGWVQARQRSTSRSDSQPTPAQPAAPAQPAVPPQGTGPAPQPAWNRTAPSQPRNANGALGATQQKIARGQVKLNEVDTLAPAQRRWTMDLQQALGIKGALGQGKIVASTLAVTERMVTARKSAAALRTAYSDRHPDDAALKAFDQLAAFGSASNAGAGDRAVLLKAIDAARLDETNWDEAASGALVKDLDVLRATVRAEDLRDQVTRLGMPPWSMNNGLKATAAKVELDLLSSLNGDPAVEPFSGSAMDTFWVKRKDHTGQDARSFLCKAPSDKEVVEGVPAGGEVAREGLSAVVASKLAGRLGLSMNVPETHAVPVDNAFLPKDKRSRAGPTVTCSIQEVRENSGDMKALSLDARAAFAKEECAALAILDLVTLNTDRHGGNLLVGLDGKLVPIDHGACMPESSEDSLSRMADSLGAPRNILLSLPGTHEPMSKELRTKLAALDPSALTGELKHMRDAVERNTPEVAGKISDKALDMSGRAALFLKTAAAVEVDGQTLSPASIQVAFGAHVQRLLEPNEDGSGFKLGWNEFIAEADKIARQALADQPLIKLMSLMGNAEKEALGTRLREQGFRYMGVNEGAYSGIGSDPGRMARALVSGRNASQRLDELTEEQQRAQRLPAADVAREIAKVRLANIEALLKHHSGEGARKVRADIAADRNGLLADPDRLSRLVEQVTADIAARMRQQIADLRTKLGVAPASLDKISFKLDKGDLLAVAHDLFDQASKQRKAAPASTVNTNG